jgi:hypothetical protein
MGADKKPIPEEPRAKFHHFCEIMTHNLILAGAWGKRRIPR